MGLVSRQQWPTDVQEQTDVKIGWDKSNSKLMGQGQCVAALERRLRVSGTFSVAIHTINTTSNNTFFGPYATP